MKMKDRRSLKCTKSEVSSVANNKKPLPVETYRFVFMKISNPDTKGV